MTGGFEMLSKKLIALQVGFMNWTRSAAMWIVWNVPTGRFAPTLLGYALRSKPVLVGSKSLKEK